jgi:hypothetical protein
MNTEFAVRHDEPFSIDPLGILRADHRRIERSFALYRQAQNEAQCLSIMQDILQAVNLHLDIEEAIFYPAYLGAIEDKSRFRRWVSEHAAERKLLNDIAYADPGDESLEHSLATLERRTLAHIREEESESGAFHEISRAAVDLDKLSRRLRHHRDNCIATAIRRPYP